MPNCKSFNGKSVRTKGCQNLRTIEQKEIKKLAIGKVDSDFEYFGYFEYFEYFKYFKYFEVF